MAEIPVSLNPDNPIWAKLAPILELCMNDWSEKEALLSIEELGALCVDFGAENTIRCLQETVEECSWELYYFARAGVKEVVPYFEELLSSDDENLLTTAVQALIYFGHKGAWQVLDEFYRGEHRVKLDQEFSWYFDEDLKNINNNQAKKYLS